MKMTPEQQRQHRIDAIAAIESHEGDPAPLRAEFEQEYWAEFTKEPHASGGTVTRLTMLGLEATAWQGDGPTMDNWAERARRIFDL